ncbi:MAG: hypothetical protein SPJ13_06310 [Bacteroidales bacterium]|nr:hypothetical protein [Bacteroidales bacterium]
MSRNTLAFIPLAALFCLAAPSCERNGHCHIPVGETSFSVFPNDASYHGLNAVGGYMYFIGGHRGVVVIRTEQNAFAAYERSCPLDTNTSVRVSDALGSAVLECPKCGSRFSVYTSGIPLEGSGTPCSLYQYGTTYDGNTLFVY